MNVFVAALLLSGVTIETLNYAINLTPPPRYILTVENEKGGEIFSVLPDGRIILGPGASLDAASLAFWKMVEYGATGTCRKILQQRKE